MALINCDECGKSISAKALACVHCGAPISDKIKTKGEYLDNNPVKIIAEYRYSMFEAAPLWLLIFIATSFVGVGIILLVTWSIIMSPRPRLTITDRSLIYKDALLQKRIINFNDIENITANGSPFQKMIGAGYLLIKRKGLLNLPILVNGLSDPKEIKKLILKYKN